MASSSRGEIKYGYEDSRFEKNFDEHFHCSICYNVVKEPRTCRNNDHLFCLECISPHLKVNSETCPECSEALSLDTLRRPRLLNNYLSKLKINCDYAYRGCPQFACVEDLSMHVANVALHGFFSNENCGLEISMQEKERHETMVCEYRKMKCGDCVQIKESLVELNQKVECTNERMKKLDRSLTELNEKVTVTNAEAKDNFLEMKRIVDVVGEKVETLARRHNDIEQKVERDVGELRGDLGEVKKDVGNVKKDVGKVKKDVGEVKKEVKGVKENVVNVKRDVDKVKVMVSELLEKFNSLTLLNKQPSQIHAVLSTPRKDILIAGGTFVRRSAEIYSWEKGSWFEISPMNVDQSSSSSFIYNDKLFVVGGGDTKTIEFLDLKNFPLTWKKLPGELPYCCFGHQTVVCQQRVFYIGGYNRDKDEATDAISEFQLTSPFTMRELCKMTEPRYFHGVEIIEDKVLTLGGEKSFGLNCAEVLRSVVEFDPKTNVCRDMPPLPQPVFDMATVSWRDQVVVLGGVSGQQSNDVFRYDCKTGKTTALPSMLKKRYGCCAVITGDTIVVMGGRDEQCQGLNSVEYFRMGSSTLEYLPAMSKMYESTIPPRQRKLKI